MSSTITAALLAFFCSPPQAVRAHRNIHGYLSDIKATAVVTPAPDTAMPDRRSFEIVGSFENVGDQDLYDVPIRAEIRRCGDHALVFRSDTTADAILVDSAARSFRFPISQGIWATRGLSAGCYRIAVIARQPDDGDRSDDTASATLTLNRAPLSDDIGCDSILAPRLQDRHGIDTTIHVVARIVNSGQNSEYGQIVRLTVSDNWTGAVVFRDSITLPVLTPGDAIPIAFSGFAPRPSMYRVKVVTSLGGDEWYFDDTAHSSFEIGYPDQAINIIRPMIPMPNQNIPTASSWQPTLRVRWVGYAPPQPFELRAKILSDKNNSECYSSSAIIQPTDWTNDSATVTWSTQYPNTDVSKLPRGFYTAILGTDTIGFQLGVVVHDSSLAVICPLYAADSGRISPYRQVDMYYRFRNSGFDTVRHVTFVSTVTNCSDSLVYRDTARFDGIWAPARDQDISFRGFYPPGFSRYVIKCYSLYPNERWRIDDTSTIRVCTNDAFLSLDTIRVPAFGQNIVAGTAFDPTVQCTPFPYFGTYRNLPFEFQIVDSATNTTVYQLDTLIETIPETCSSVEFTLPGVSSGNDVRQLSPGTYYAMAMTFDSGYLDWTHLQTTNTFYVVPNSSTVYQRISTTTVFQPNVFPNPFDGRTVVRYVLPMDAAMRLSVRDLLGRTVLVSDDASVQPAGEHTSELVMNNVPEGAYVLTFTATEPKGRSYSVSRIISLVHSLQR